MGLRDPDDAAVWRLDEERALVVTTDFFTPVVDEAYDMVPLRRPTASRMCMQWEANLSLR